VPVVSLGTSGTAYTVSRVPTADPTGVVAGFADADGGYLPLVCTLNCTLAVDRFAQWAEVVETIAATHGHPGLIGSCATCCAEAFTASGDWVGAEQQLRAALGALGAAGHTGRCIGPAAKLAELLID
jgi:hypothetical protein